MAANYVPNGSRETTEVDPTLGVVKVIEFGFRTVPSNIAFQFRRTLTKATPANVASVAEQLATRIEAVDALPNVTGLAYSQDWNAAGQLVDNFTVYWVSPDGTQSGHFVQPMADLGPTRTDATSTRGLLAAAIAHAASLVGG